MNQGSTPITVFTVDQPATFSSRPRGIAIVTFAQIPWRLVRKGGAEYAQTRTLVNSTIQKHSRRPSGAASHASTQASTNAADGEAPGLAHRHGAGRQRPLRLVHAVDREVVDLVDRVAGRVEHGGHQRAVDDGQEERPGDRGLLVARAPGGDGAGEHPERRRQQRERPREVEVDLQASGAGGRQRGDGGGHQRIINRASATARAAPMAVFSAFSRSLSSQPRRSATVPMTLSARLPRSPASATSAAMPQP